MKKSARSFVFAAGVFLSAGLLSHLQAQSMEGGGTLTISSATGGATETAVINGGTLTLGSANATNGQSLPTLSPRLYAGSVTQTTAAGQLTTGTFYLNVTPKGRLSAAFVLNGTMTVYVGALARKADGERARNGSGYLVPADANYHRVPGAAKIPLVVEADAANGGTMDEAGNSLVFRAKRSEVELSNLGTTVLGGISGITINGGITLPGGTVVIGSGH